MLGQTVFYTFSDADLLHFGALREPVRVAVVTEDLGDDMVALHVFMPSSVKTVRRVVAGEPGQPGTWNAALPAPEPVAP